MLGNLFAQPLTTSSLVYLLVWSSPPHIPYTVWKKAKKLTQPPVDNGGEYLGLAGVLELSEGQVVEVAHDAMSDRVPAAPWRTHRAHEVHVR